MTQKMDTPTFAPFAEKMKTEGLPELVIEVFQYYYNQLVAGETGFISSTEAQPVTSLPDAAQFDNHYMAVGREALNRAVVLKLNGGLGTGMGISGPKSLITVKEDLSFLDIIIKQIQYLRTQYHARLPLVLMNSFNTQEATLAKLVEIDDFAQDIPYDFLQHKEPKVDANSLHPISWPHDPEKEWCPPGHGDIYPALITSGILQQLLDAGYEYVFVSNADNLGATLNLAILGYVAEEASLGRLPFLMEVADRTPADKKGGHLAQRSDGQLILREIAQCPPDEIDCFQNIAHYRYFNTNNLWLHLPTLQNVLVERHGVLGLPLIRNTKTVDPTDPDSPKVYQLETAMGSAIGIFGGAQAIRVPRDRFVPVKRNNDLLLLWSDVYQLTDDGHLIVNPERTLPLPQIDLDTRYYGRIDDLRTRFPHGAPSLLNCTSLTVRGDVCFGDGVTLVGEQVFVQEEEEQLKVES